MNRLPRRPQRKAPPLRGRAVTRSSLDHANFAPLCARPIVHQPPPQPKRRSGGILNQPGLGGPSKPNGYDSPNPKPITPPLQSEPVVKPGTKPGVKGIILWAKRWGWFVALTLLIMAIVIIAQR
ncbi:MAG: hypothetical protein AAGD25_29495 [Cyanobacteria bacterium P01_F01_bin.150]